MDSEKYHANLYKEMGDLKNDFRNLNLNNLILSKAKGESFLDIGSGNGYLLGLLRKKERKVYGIEPNKDLILLSKKINPGLKIQKGFAEDIDILISNTFDCILMIDVLEHVKNDGLLISKIYNHLNESGMFIIVVPAFQFLFGKRDMNNGHYRRYSKKNLVDKLSNNGFKIIEVRYWNFLGFFPYLFYERIFKRELNTELRVAKKKSFVKNTLQTILYLWFKYIENNCSFGFGLSIICVAKKFDKSVL